jgi:hypothetical protein
VNPGIEIAEAVAEGAPGFAHSQLHAWRRAYAGVMDPSYLASMDLERMTRRWSEMLGDPVPCVHHLALRAGGETVGWSRCGNPRDDVEDGAGEHRRCANCGCLRVSSATAETGTRGALQTAHHLAI